MKKTKFIFTALLLLIAASVIGACAAPAPTPTSVPPTATPVPPTVPPTQPPSSSAGEGNLAQAMAKAQAAHSYRMTLNVSGKGNFMAAGEPTPEAADATKPITLVTMQGEVNGQNAHFVIQGMLTAFLGIDPSKPFEVITYNGEGFIKGPAPLVGAPEAKWYKAPPQAAQIAQPPLSPSAFLDSFAQAGISPADFKLAGTETLDEQQCEVYAGDKSAVVNAFSKLGGAAGATQQDLDAIDNAEFKFWVCADGYLHQIKMVIEGHDQAKPEQKGAFELLLQLSDFNGDIAITPPADAESLQLPTPEAQQPVVTPTP